VLCVNGVLVGHASSSIIHAMMINVISRLLPHSASTYARKRRHTHVHALGVAHVGFWVSAACVHRLNRSQHNSDNLPPPSYHYSTTTTLRRTGTASAKGTLPRSDSSRCSPPALPASPRASTTPWHTRAHHRRSSPTATPDVKDPSQRNGESTPLSEFHQNGDTSVGGGQTLAH
jgi:hypothetical protein